MGRSAPFTPSDMPRFVFRAAAALDLRRREEETAVRARAAAAAAVERAERAVADARGALTSQLEAGASEHDPARRLWYRNWIDRKRQEIAHARAMAADRRTALEAAIHRANAAHRDVRALERLRDRLFQAWQTAERRAEQKELDWLGTVRHTMAARDEAARREDIT
jgi:flagellar export protein FliJ